MKIFQIWKGILILCGSTIIFITIVIFYYHVSHFEYKTVLRIYLWRIIILHLWYFEEVILTPIKINYRNKLLLYEKAIFLQACDLIVEHIIAQIVREFYCWLTSWQCWLALFCDLKTILKLDRLLFLEEHQSGIVVYAGIMHGIARERHPLRFADPVDICVSTCRYRLRIKHAR